MSGGILASRDAKAILIGAIIILIAFGGVRGVPRLLSWTRHQQQLAARSATSVADARVAVKSAAALRDSAHLGRLRLSSLDSAFLVGPTVSQAAANLASELSENAEVVDARVEALQADSAADSRSPVRRVRVRGSVTGELGVLMQFLLLIESGPRLLTVRDLALSRREVASATQPEMIHATFVVEGLVRSANQGAHR